MIVNNRAMVLVLLTQERGGSRPGTHLTASLVDNGGLVIRRAEVAVRDKGRNARVIDAIAR